MKTKIIRFCEKYWKIEKEIYFFKYKINIRDVITDCDQLKWSEIMWVKDNCHRHGD